MQGTHTLFPISRERMRSEAKKRKLEFAPMTIDRLCACVCCDLFHKPFVFSLSFFVVFRHSRNDYETEASPAVARRTTFPAAFNKIQMKKKLIVSIIFRFQPKWTHISQWMFVNKIRVILSSNEIIVYQNWMRRATRMTNESARVRVRKSCIQSK